MSINFLEINNATFAASKKNKVLDFNLTIKNEGDIVCLLGPSVCLCDIPIDVGKVLV